MRDHRLRAQAAIEIRSQQRIYPSHILVATFRPVVAGAIVTVLDAAGNQAHAPVKTDSQGKFKIEGLPAGTYIVVINAAGFKEARRGEVRIEESKNAVADVRLEIAPVESTVEVKATGPKPNEDPIYQQLRQQAESLQRRARADEQANQPGGQRQKKDGDQQHGLSLSTG